MSAEVEPPTRKYPSEYVFSFCLENGINKEKEEETIIELIDFSHFYC